MRFSKTLEDRDLEFSVLKHLSFLSELKAGIKFLSLSDVYDVCRVGHADHKTDLFENQTMRYRDIGV